MENDVLTTSPRFAEILGFDPKTWKPTMASLETALHRAFARKRILQAGSHYDSIPLLDPPS